MQRLVMLNMDPPQHTKLRAIVVARLHPAGDQQPARRRSPRGPSASCARRWQPGTGDFVTDVACELPLQAIAELLGVPQEDRRKIFDWSNEMIGYDDPEYARRRPDGRRRWSCSATR